MATDDAKLTEAARVLRAWQGAPGWRMAPEELNALDALCAAHEVPEWPPVEYGPLEAEDLDNTDSGPGFYTGTGDVIGPRACDDLLDMLCRQSLEPVDTALLGAWFADRGLSGTRALSAAMAAVEYLRRRKLLKPGKDGRDRTCYYLRVGHRACDDDGYRLRDARGRYV